MTTAPRCPKAAWTESLCPDPTATVPVKRVSPLKAARLAIGITQYELAMAVDMTESRISRIETGRTVPDAKTRRRIASVLGIAPFEVRGGAR